MSMSSMQHSLYKNNAHYQRSPTNKRRRNKIPFFIGTIVLLSVCLVLFSRLSLSDMDLALRSSLTHDFNTAAHQCSTMTTMTMMTPALPKNIRVPQSNCPCQVPGQWTAQSGQDKYLFERVFHPQDLCCKGGTFVEFGARNGIVDSNTFGFEHCMGWTGLLFELDPREFVELERNRPGSVVIKGAVCPAGIETVPVVLSQFGGLSGALHQYEDTRRQYESDQTLVQCYDLAKELRKRDMHTVDYMTVDTEGSEVDIVLDFPWDDFDIRVVQIEQLVSEKYPSQVGKKEKIIQHMTSHDYVLYEVYVVAEFDTDDLIFVRNLPSNVVIPDVRP